jgi:hypothetical protein
VSAQKKFLLPTTLLVCALSASAATLTGTVTNRTSSAPSPGDTIAVINTAQGMDEIAKATSDARGAFHVAIPEGGQILLHITHRDADYFKSVPANSTSVDIDVYDSAPKVPGITGEALVVRAETDPTGKTLSIAQNFFVQNPSTPPRTEYGANTFDFYLPKGAAVEQSVASAPGGLPTNVKLVTIDAAAGHYAYTFPIRPGETRFQVLYSLPYSGSQPFTIKLSIPTGDVAVMLPLSMKFDGGAQFQPIAPDPGSQTFDAHSPPANQPIVFTLSGTGQLPQNTQSNSQAEASGTDTQSASAPANTARPGGGLGIPEDPDATNDPWAKYKGWIIGGLGILLAAGAGIMLRSSANSSELTAPPPPSTDIAGPPGTYNPSPAIPSHSTPLLRSLKEELFLLETDRLSGALTEAEYAHHKAALDLILRRALTRTSQPHA